MYKTSLLLYCCCIKINTNQCHQNQHEKDMLVTKYCNKQSRQIDTVDRKIDRQTDSVGWLTDQFIC